MSNIKTWAQRRAESDHTISNWEFAQHEITDLRSALAEREAEIKQDKIIIDVAASDVDRLEYALEYANQVVAQRNAELSDRHTALAERDAELLQAKASAAIWHERYTAACTLNKDDAAKRGAEIVGLEDELATFRTAAQQALEALVHAYNEDEAHPNTIAAITALQSALGGPTT